MAVLKRIGVLSLAKVFALTYALIGLVVGIFIVLGGALFGARMGASGMLASMGLLSIITLPIMYGFIGFLSGIVTAAVYNLAASWVGGLELEFNQ